MRIADSTTQSPVGDFDVGGLGNASVNGGSVAFQACYGGGAGCGIFLGSGGPLTTVVQDGMAAPLGMFDSIPPLSFANPPAIDGSTIAFRGDYQFNAMSGEYQQQGIFAGDGAAVTTLVTTGDAAPLGAFKTFFDPAISGTAVAFQAAFATDSQGIFISNGGAPTPVATTSDVAPGLSTYTGFTAPSVSGDTVTFAGSYSGGQGIFARTGGGPLEVIAKSGDLAPVGSPMVQFDDGNFGQPAISGDSIAFRASYGGADGTGIFRSISGALVNILKTGDPAPNGTINGLASDPSISGDLVAFVGNYGAQHAVFVGNGTAVAPVIKKGDILFGSSVASLELGRFGLDTDGSGRLAFSYKLVDGRTGVAIATPGGLPLGDYDGSGEIDAADYVLWRSTFGDVVAEGTGADGNFNGVVDINDYFLWRNRFGQKGETQLGNGSAVAVGASSVPEPAGWSFCLCGALCLALCRR